MKQYELIYIWKTGEKETAIYNSKRKAQEIEKGLKKVFGNQITFLCINEVMKGGSK